MLFWYKNLNDWFRKQYNCINILVVVFILFCQYVITKSANLSFYGQLMVLFRGTLTLQSIWFLYRVFNLIFFVCYALGVPYISNVTPIQDFFFCDTHSTLPMFLFKPMRLLLLFKTPWQLLCRFVSSLG